MGWFRRSAGRHSYGVRVVARPAADAPPVAPPPPVAPARLPDDRTTEQIGGKVAEVLWGYYRQPDVSGTALTQASAVASPAYDDAYADTLIAEIPARIAVAPPAISPVASALPPSLRPPPPQPTPVHSIAGIARYQVFQRLRPPAPHLQETDLPEPRAHVVQLGFVDGTTMDLAGDHPAAKALRAAADALTLRE